MINIKGSCGGVVVCVESDYSVSLCPFSTKRYRSKRKSKKRSKKKMDKELDNFSMLRGLS